MPRPRPTNEPRRWRIGVEDAGQRTDRFLAERLDKPRNQIQRWFGEGRVEVNERSAKPSTVLQDGDHLSCRPPDEVADPGLVAEAGELTVLYEDQDLAVVDKPCGLAVHPGAGRRGGTLANFLLHRYPQIAGVGGPGRPGIVHRLDLDTSGALIVALNETAYLHLSRAFADRQIQKTYLALAYGRPDPAAGTVDLPLGRHRQERKRMTVRGDGRPARTHYRTVASANGICCLELDLETGRTHQIRVHLKAIGHPLIGDPAYGEARWRGLPKRLQAPLRRFPRPALHAWRVVFDPPRGGGSLEVEAPVPDDLRSLWEVVAGEDWPQVEGERLLGRPRRR